jgi:hypothetical protein
MDLSHMIEATIATLAYQSLLTAEYIVDGNSNDEGSQH